MTKGGFNIKLVIGTTGYMAIFESVLLFVTCAVAVFFGEYNWKYYVQCGGLALGIGTVLMIMSIGAEKNITKKEGAIIVSLVWIIFSLIGMLPYLLTDTLDNVTDAFFETMSGFTTTGATVISDIDSQPRSILFWRALTQWTGGIGIIVISLALLPTFGFNGTMMFAAEMAGPTKDKISPRLSDTAKKLGLIYFALTVIETIALRLCGMPLFDAVCNSMTTVSTGGLCTKSASMAYWGIPVQYVVTLFMFLSGVNYTLYYFAFIGKMKKKVLRNDELKWYFIIVISAAVALFCCLFDINTPISFSYVEEVVRTSLFQTVTTITSTGFAMSDHMTWPSTTWIILILLMLCGASAGSSTGGIKLSRIIIALKYCYYEFKRMVHPRAVIPITSNGNVIKQDIISRVFAFIFLYAFITIVGSLILTFSGLGLTESISGMVECITNSGVGLGQLAHSLDCLSDFHKWFMAFAMLIGRLEIFTVLIIFTPVFWDQ